MRMRRTFSVPCESRWPGQHQVPQQDSSGFTRFPIVAHDGAVDPSRDDHCCAAHTALIVVQHAIFLSKLRRHHASARTANQRCSVFPKPHPVGCDCWFSAAFLGPVTFSPTQIPTQHTSRLQGKTARSKLSRNFTTQPGPGPIENSSRSTPGRTCNRCLRAKIVRSKLSRNFKPKKTARSKLSRNFTRVDPQSNLQ